MTNDIKVDDGYLSYTMATSLTYGFMVHNYATKELKDAVAYISYTHA